MEIVNSVEQETKVQRKRCDFKKKVGVETEEQTQMKNIL